jgi:hypothetical protein
MRHPAPPAQHRPTMGLGRTSNIFTKLGVSSRAAATAYADEFHLL